MKQYSYEMMEQQNEVVAYFNSLYFDPYKHQYWVDNRFVVRPSVSELVKDFYDPFNEFEMSKRVAQKRNVPHEKVMKEWKMTRDEGASRGTNTHEYAAICIHHPKAPPRTEHERAVLGFVQSLPEFIVPFAIERSMYHKTLAYAGTCDLILYNQKTSKFTLCDYKTNKELFKNWKEKKMRAPFDHLLENDFNKYQIQLSLYQLMFEQTGIKISSRKLIWVKADGNFEVHETDDYTETLKEYLKAKNARKRSHTENTVAVQ